MRWIRQSVMFVISAIAWSCAEGPTGTAREAAVRMDFLTPATVRRLVIEVSGPGISPPVVLNLAVAADSTASGSITVTAGSRRRFRVSAFDSLGVETHRADTTITLEPGGNPPLALQLLPLPSTLGIVVTFGGVRLAVSDTTTRTLIRGDSAVISAVATMASGDTVPADSLTWGTSNPAIVDVSAGVVRAKGAGTASVTVSYRGAAAVVRVESSIAGAATQLAVISGPADAVAGDALSPIIIEVQDSLGVRVATYNQPVILEFAANPTDTWLLGDTAVVAVGGRATFDAVGVGLPGSGYRLRARSGALTSALTGTFAASAPVVPVDETSIAANGTAYCALAAAGDAYCWGSGNQGQLGNGDQLSRFSPTPVSGGRTFRSIAMGNGHSCGVTSAGEAHCWGRNSFGAIGNGTTVPTTVPVAVQGGLLFNQLDLGTISTCGLTAAGEAYCWGRNVDGRLGTGDSLDHMVPVPVAAPVLFTKLTVGGFGACGVTAGGWVYCWGVNRGRFGNGSTEPRTLSPVRAGGGRRFASLQLADLVDTQSPLTCGVTLSNEAYCWGLNRQGQFGNGQAPFDTLAAPVPAMSGLLPARFVLAEGARACAIDALRRAYCWGRSDGAIGDGDVHDRFAPTPVLGAISFSDIATSSKSSCGISTAGALYCWGTDALGDGGTSTNPSAPVRVLGGDGLTEIALGKGVHSCGGYVDGSVRCWGRNTWGQIGNGTTSTALQPAGVSGASNYSAFALMVNTSCATDDLQRLQCWGSNGSGALGLPTDIPSSSVPVLAQTGLRFNTLVAGQSHGCGIATDAKAYCWGANSLGQGGNGTTTSPAAFLPVAGDFAFSRLAAGGSFTCGIADAKAYCWGLNNSGQLGSGTLTSVLSSPTPVFGSIATAQVTAGINHACLLSTSGVVYCWGIDSNGQLGRGTSIADPSIPGAVLGGIQFSQLAAGASHTCGLALDGQAYCWGANLAGQLGTGTYLPSAEPVAVVGDRSFVSLVAGDATTCALTSLRELFCWGSNGDGRLAIPTPLSPAAVPGVGSFRVVN